MTIAMPNPRRRAFMLAVAVFWLIPGVAEAHVKWFCGPIDGSIPPAPLHQVLSPLFLTDLVVFAVLVGMGAAIDALLGRRIPVSRPAWMPVAADVIVRIGMAAYGVALWRNLAVVLWADEATGAVLTPELIHRGQLIGLLQLAIAASVLVPRLSIAAGAGLSALWAIGALKFGLFYMVDYLFFPGIALYVAFGDPLLRRWPDLAGWRAPILVGSLAFSLMWTAVEKFLFPQWTIAVLLHHPGVTAGFPFPTVAIVGGFVEFSLSFYLLVGRRVLGRMAAVVFAGVFVIAMPEFGMVDVVGHIPVLVILIAALLHGETRLQRWFRGPATGVLSSAAGVTTRYAATLVALMALYYGLHAVAIWTRPTPNQPASSAAATYPGPIPFLQPGTRARP